MKHIILLLLITLAAFSQAQVVNIENKRVNDGTYGFSGALDFTFSAQRQKDLLVTLHFKPLVQFKFGHGRMKEGESNEVDTLGRELNENKEVVDKNRHMLLWINDLKYTGGNSTTYANFGMTHLRYAYRIANSGWKWESYGQVQYNQLLLQKVRAIIGTGLRSKVLDLSARDGGYANRAIRMFFGTSAFYEYEEINYSDRPIEFINSIRWSNYLSAYLNFRSFEFSTSIYYQPNFAQFKDFRVSGDYSLLLRISDPFSVKFNLTHFFDAMPPETVTKKTFSFSAGFVYKLDKFKIDKEKMKEKKQQRKERREADFLPFE